MGGYVPAWVGGEATTGRVGLTATFSVLVVASRTADSSQLLDALRARAARGPVRFTLLAPANIGREATAQNLEAGLAHMRDSGLDVDGRIGDSDPISAVDDAWDPSEFDEIIVSTLAAKTSNWLAIGLPQRVARLTGALVTHVEAS